MHSLVNILKGYKERRIGEFSKSLSSYEVNNLGFPKLFIGYIKCICECYLSTTPILPYIPVSTKITPMSYHEYMHIPVCVLQRCLLLLI